LGYVLDRFEKVVNRFLDLMVQMDRMYINILEEAVIGEAEIMEKKNVEPVDMLKLIGYRILKEVALKELGCLSGNSETGFLESMSREESVVSTEDVD